MKVTIYDVAKRANVSIATVSKAINNSGNMRAETRKRILDIVKEMNYHPSVMASAMTGKGTKIIGLLVPDVSNPFFSAIARRIEDCAHEQGMSVIMCSTDEDAEKEKKYLELLQGKQVDGFIIATTFQNQSLLQTLIKNNTPLVMLSYDDSTLDVSKVSIDDFEGGYMATAHLLSAGHQNIAVIAEHVHSSKLRIEGYHEAFKAHKLVSSNQQIIKTTASISNGRKYFREIYERSDVDRPTAIFACNDLLAIGVIQGTIEQGIKVPDELAIVGFDNTILATTTVPGLTTIAQPIEKMGERIVDILIEEIREKRSLKRRTLFNPKLIIRGTT